ncbi:phage tail tube protein [Streptomyces olivoreticuli]|uniref:phage tail tube protein n=1 Tax=Streptomyces olivoreticuli TaxID=68246 RepID=UPI00265A4CA3|nr:phage tail tube protein [Streptomyces olivoreticuli]WKK26567.1 phage tail tube protein [Streptomyces olivoreticuli]
MPQPSFRSVLGIAKETTFGTPVAATAFLPVKTMGPKDQLKLLEDKGQRGSLVEAYDAIAGPVFSEYDFDGDVFPDTFGWALTGILGDLTTTGTSAPYTHSLAVLNTGTGQPPSYTISDNYSIGARQFPGARFSEVSMKFSGDAMVTYSAKATCLASATTSAPIPSYTAVPPLAGWVGAVTIGGAAATYVMEGECTIKRSVTPIHTVDGSQAPYALWSGPLTTSGKLTLVMEDDSQLTNYLTNAKPSLDINYQQGTGAAAVQVKEHMSKVAYTNAQIARGKDFIELTVDFAAMANTSDAGASGGYSPVKVTLQNAIAPGVYK